MENIENNEYNSNPSGENLILFLCYGNVYRSQWAEAFFNHNNTNPEYRAVSAGVVRAEMEQDSIELMLEKGIDISDHLTKKLRPLIMEYAHTIYDLAGYFSGIDNEKLIDMHVEDPASRNLEVKRQIRDQIEVKVNEILQELPRS